MIALAALSGPLPKTGVVVLGLLVAVVLLAPTARTRAAAMLLALLLAPVLLLADIWHSPQLAAVHRHPTLAIAGGGLIVAMMAGFAVLLQGRERLFALLVIAALPFRIPIQAGGTTSNLLVPLYAVVGVGALAYVIAVFRPRGGQALDAPGARAPARDPASRSLRSAVHWLERLLAVYVVLYAIQATYSSDFEKALQQMVFFYAPFALVFALLRRLTWTPRLLRSSLELVAVLAVLFAVVGFVEYATKTIILNPRLVVQNDLHAYFTVNSVFFDPDIFGRFLALVMIALAAALIHARGRNEQLVLTAVLAVLWAGLVLTLSRSSLGALLLGLAVLALLRWRPPGRFVLAAGGGVVVIALIAVAALPKTFFGLNQGLNGASSGRAGLVSGGLKMFSQRPLWGYGSGAFVAQYRRQHPAAGQTLAASHTIAVTIAAEQGLIGEVAYIALVLAALWMLFTHARGDPARVAVAGAVVALVLHTNLYADFLEDPMSWTLFGLGAALAAARAHEPRADSIQSLAT